jgi:glycosyltransferase involved in cell wall biosynthesis
MKVKSLSIFFPFWNEAKNVEQVVEAAIPVAEEVAEQWEIIIVDDGSTDNTLEIANRLAAKNPNIRVVSHSPNRGYGGALKEGLSNAKYEYVVFTDGDGQFDFSEVKLFLEKINNHDIVIGHRKKRRDNHVRFVLMKMLKLWDFILFGFRFTDIDCGFKMFSRSAINELLPLRSEGAMITTEILAKAKKKKLKITEVEVSHFPRKHGVQSGANFGVISRAVLESLMLWSDLHNGRF